MGRQRTAVGCLSLTAAVDQPTAGSSSSPCCSQTFHGKSEQLSPTFLLLECRWEGAVPKCIHSFLITHLQPAGYSNRQNRSIRERCRLTESDCHATVYIYSLFLVHLCNFIARVILEVKSNWNMINTLMVICCGQSAGKSSNATSCIINCLNWGKVHGVNETTSARLAPPITARMENIKRTRILLKREWPS